MSYYYLCIQQGCHKGQKIRKSQEKRGVFEKMSVKVSKFDKKKVRFCQFKFNFFFQSIQMVKN